MNLTQFSQFLNVYGLPAIIISAVVSVSVFFIDKFFKDKLPYGISGYIPFVLGVILFIAYDMIFNTGKLTVSEQSVSSGLACGTIAGIICAFFKTYKTDASLSAGALAVYSVISEYVKENSAISLSAKIEKIVSGGNQNQDELIKNIALLLSENAKQRYFDYDFTEIAKLLIITVKNASV